MLHHPKPTKANKEDPTTQTVEDTLKVYKKCAVFFSQDTLEIRKRKKEMGEEEFYAGADDYVYYQGIALHYLDSVKLPVFYMRNEKVVVFINGKRPVYTAKINAEPELMGAFFYDPPKEVLKPELLDINEEYNSYFNN